MSPTGAPDTARKEPVVRASAWNGRPKAGWYREVAPRPCGEEGLFCVLILFAPGVGGLRIFRVSREGSSVRSSEIRAKFLEFFREKDHLILPSASLIPQDDPSLLFINSGVATLKKYFDGREAPPSRRLASAQKSIRTNDIEQVGKTSRHHTFFEMLGNFSVGDYFKREAIRWAWEFLTDPRWIGFPPERLSVTIHPEDEEAYAVWHEEIGLPDERIVRLEGNFWDIGEGPSGPNSEIFFDRGPAFGDDPDDPELYPGGENERYIEIWNLVFSQFNHNPDGTYTPLPSKNIDTGMGLERMASILQGGRTNFDTDLFLPIIRGTEDLSGRRYGSSPDTDVAFRVIADHVRTLAFAIGDGALPSNEGRGYVLRRLLRRAMRYGRNLGLDRPFLYELAPIVGEIMGDVYPEVREKARFIQEVVREEEERFLSRLDAGMKLLEKYVTRARAEGRSELTGDEAFTLYDTYGFPFDLTLDYAQEAGLAVDRAGFEERLEEQRERARRARGEVDSMQVQGGDLLALEAESRFVGYETLEVSRARVEAIFDREGRRVRVLEAGEEGEVVLHETPFYAESGGQIGDRGVLEGDFGFAIVTDVRKAPRGQHLHRVTVRLGRLRVGDVVRAKVDENSRSDIMRHHTATHLLHAALRRVLGTHVVQAGSFVGDAYLRFDFTHPRPLSREERQAVEDWVNEQIWRALPVNTFLKPLDEARAMGAMALFGEKYGEIVRVVEIPTASLELCGGTHVANTQEILLFKIVSETGIGSGVRRIEAVAGPHAYRFTTERLALLDAVAARLEVGVEEILPRLETLAEERKSWEREREALLGRWARLVALGLLERAETLISPALDGERVELVTGVVDVSDADALRIVLDVVKEGVSGRGRPYAIALGATPGPNRVNLLLSFSPELVARGFDAGKRVREMARFVGGGGGGRPDLGQAGGRDPSGLAEALRFVRTWFA
ncbi:MAG: Alanyl-tRNA synthetase [Brockia lithotrophica]|uniref:Alanine--tRNA ligase n=1 Tax=Brockia lithotrophica TaxID=933949 RepID=A0A2T5G5N0_9BACL|nr:MAG: Alanyl-tRNA synthetase [Brockia lithotrophica]